MLCSNSRRKKCRSPHTYTCKRITIVIPFWCSSSNSLWNVEKTAFVNVDPIEFKWIGMEWNGSIATANNVGGGWYSKKKWFSCGLHPSVFTSSTYVYTHIFSKKNNHSHGNTVREKQNSTIDFQPIFVVFVSMPTRFLFWQIHLRHIARYIKLYRKWNGYVSFTGPNSRKERERRRGRNSIEVLFVW